ncbi:V4R domain-containing protein [Methanosarcina horonobensis]|nr:V4R domain-containing protein [Methanosarcina horonobensis]
MGCSQEPFIGHYRSLLKIVAANGNDRFRFMETLFHVLRFGFEAYGIDNAPVVKMIGIDIGKHLSASFESSTPEALFNEIARFLEFHGDCRVSVITGNSPALRVEDDFKAGSMPVTGKPFCALREGIIEGIIKEKLEKECGVLEVECYGTGHNHCLFEITV